jgi:hypothetical protein
MRPAASQPSERRASGFAAARDDVHEAVRSTRARDGLAKPESHQRSLFGEASPTMKWNWMSGCFCVS